MRVFYKQASQLYSLVYAFMLAYKKCASATPVLLWMFQIRYTIIYEMDLVKWFLWKYLNANAEWYPMRVFCGQAPKKAYGCVGLRRCKRRVSRSDTWERAKAIFISPR